MNSPWNFKRGILAIDFETASDISIKYGAWIYSRHRSTLVWCAVFGYAESKDKYQFYSWTPGEELPKEIIEYIKSGGKLLAHNCSFEKSIWENIMVFRYKWPVVKDKQWCDTQALANNLNLPSSLEGLSNSLGLANKKDMEGHDLMKKMANLKQDKNGDYFSPHDTIENRKRLLEYCKQDVKVTLDCWLRLPKLSITEELVWKADQTINKRGVYINQKFANSCITIFQKRKEELSLEVQQLTNFELINSTSTPSLKRWLEERGVKLPLQQRIRKNGKIAFSTLLDRKTVKKLLESDDLDPTVKTILRNRIEASRITSLAKLKRIQNMIDSNGRIRFSFLYQAAITGRWSSRGLQLHNFPRNSIDERDHNIIYDAILNKKLNFLKFLDYKILEIISMFLRSVIAAPPGKLLIGGDYSAIEARVLAWLAEQNDILDLYRKNVDVYMYTAKSIGSNDRQLGKICNLALGYGMGPLKFAETAISYGIDLSNKRFYEITHLWRQQRSAITAFWDDLENAVREAIYNPGFQRDVKHILVLGKKDCFILQLPSKRRLYYWRPRIVKTTKTIKSLDENGEIIEIEMATDEIQYYSPAADGKTMIKKIYVWRKTC